MSIFDLFFGMFSPGARVYRSTIENIPGSEFSRQVKLKIGDREEYLVGEGLRDYLAGLASSGVSYTTLNDKLRKAGLVDRQYNRRLEIINTIKEHSKK